MNLPHLAHHLYGTPWLIHRAKFETVLAVLGERIAWPDTVPISSAALLTSPPAAQIPPPTAQVPPPTAQVPPPTGQVPVGVLPIHGTLLRRTCGLEADSGLTSYETVARQLDVLLADPRVAGILLDIDSAGGEAGGVFDLADRIRAACAVKPVWAVANDCAFSAAYALAAAADQVWLTRSAGVGSIGVIAMHVDQSARDHAEGYHYTAIVAGAHKNDLTPHGPLSAGAHADLQREVDRLYGLFVASVASHRRLDQAQVRATEAGLFFAEEALVSGLADQVGTFDEALAALVGCITARSKTLGAVGSLSAKTPSPAAQVAQPQSLQPPQQEIVMSEPQVPATAPLPQTVPQAPAAPVQPPSPTSQAAAAPSPTGRSYAEAVEIAELCALAGRPDATAEYLRAGLSGEAVRGRLLAARAEAAPEIQSQFTPGDFKSAPTGDAQALITAAQHRKGG